MVVGDSLMPLGLPSAVNDVPGVVHFGSCVLIVQ